MSKRSREEEEIFGSGGSFDRIFGPGGTFDRMFGGFDTRHKSKKPAKKPEPRPLTSKLRLINEGKCPRWADVWIQMISSTYCGPRLIRPTEEAADALAMLLEAGWIPPNADETAFHRWVDNDDPGAYITTDEPEEAEEVPDDSQDSPSQEEA